MAVSADDPKSCRANSGTYKATPQTNQKGSMEMKYSTCDEGRRFDPARRHARARRGSAAARRRPWRSVGAATGHPRLPPAWQRRTAADAINPAAIDALKTMEAYLHTLKSFSVRSESTTDEVLALRPQKIQFGNTVDIRSRLPDRVRIDVNLRSQEPRDLLRRQVGGAVRTTPEVLRHRTAPATVRETLKARRCEVRPDVPPADSSLGHRPVGHRCDHVPI